jgi:anti-anti-sigma factor
MSISFVDRSARFRHINLSGRLDAQGVNEIANPLAKLTSVETRQILVDLTEVSFLNSTGISELIRNASTQQKLGGRIVLLVSENSLVAKTLTAVGIDRLLPVCKSYPEAEQTLLS